MYVGTSSHLTKLIILNAADSANYTHRRLIIFSFLMKRNCFSNNNNNFDKAFIRLSEVYYQNCENFYIQNVHYAFNFISGVLQKVFVK